MGAGGGQEALSLTGWCLTRLATSVSKNQNKGERGKKEENVPCVNPVSRGGQQKPTSQEKALNIIYIIT